MISLFPLRLRPKEVWVLCRWLEIVSAQPMQTPQHLLLSWSCDESGASRCCQPEQGSAASGPDMDARHQAMRPCQQLCSLLQWGYGSGLCMDLDPSGPMPHRGCQLQLQRGTLNQYVCVCYQLGLLSSGCLAGAWLHLSRYSPAAEMQCADGTTNKPSQTVEVLHLYASQCVPSTACMREPCQVGIDHKYDW